MRKIFSAFCLIIVFMGAQKLKIILNFLGYLTAFCFVIIAKKVSFLTLQDDFYGLKIIKGERDEWLQNE